MNNPHGRREFLKKVIFGSLAGLLGMQVAPKLISTPIPSVSALGQKQLDILLASKRLMEKTGMLRAFSLLAYANDGEVGTEWTVWIPPEDKIPQDADALARQVLALTG